MRVEGEMVTEQTRAHPRETFSSASVSIIHRRRRKDALIEVPQRLREAEGV